MTGYWAQRCKRQSTLEEWFVHERETCKWVSTLLYWWKVRVIWDCQLLTPGIFYSGSETSSARSSGSLGLRLTTPLPNSGTNSLPPPPLSSASSSGSATHTPNGMNFSVAYPQPSPLPKPNGKEAINLILHWSTACHLYNNILAKKAHKQSEGTTFP